MFGRHAAAGLVGLVERATPPPPISILPSGNFLGNDGNWSTFQVRIGTPAQNLDFLPSTLSTELWAVGDIGCQDGANSDSSCVSARGGDPGLYARQNSNTFSYINGITFTIDSNLIPQGSNQVFGGNYGTDVVGLFTQDTNAGRPANTVLQNQIVAQFQDNNIWLSLLGLSPRLPNFFLNNTRPSYLTSLYNATSIPSLSYSYTAGAYYRGQTNGSLTLGGYDSNRFNSPGLSLTLNQDPFQEFQVGLQSIEYSDSTGTRSTLLGNGILAVVDSTIAPLWLPQSACDAFANAFTLEMDSLTQLYMVNDTAHDNNIRNNASVTLTIGSNISGGPTTTITLPYAAFDYYFDNPNSAQGPRRYFPLKVAGSSNLYTLGRTFLQEAVLTVDYGRGNFTVAQALPITNSTIPNIVAIANVTAPASTGGGSNPTNGGGSGSSGNSGNSGDSGQFVQNSDGGLSAGAKAGIAVGVIVGVAAVVGAILFFYFRRRKAGSSFDGEKPVDPNMPAGQQAASPPPLYPGPNSDYFGTKTATTTTPYQVNKSAAASPMQTPAIQEPGPSTAMAEMSAANTMATYHTDNHNNNNNNHNNHNNHDATLNDPMGWQRYDNNSLYPGSAATTPGAHGIAPAAAAGAAGGAAAYELVGSHPRDAAHEMSSPNLPAHEMASPETHAAELFSPVTPNLPTPSSGAVSPLPAGDASPSPNTAAASAAVAPARGPSPSMHHSQRSSTTLPQNMQPTMHEPMPANAGQNVTAAEMASNRTTMFSDVDGVSPDPEGHDAGYFSQGENSEPSISRNTSVASAVPMTAQRARVVHARSPSSPEMNRIEEGAEHQDLPSPP